LTIYLTGTTTLAPIYAEIGLTVPISNPQTSGLFGYFYTQSTGIFADDSMAYDALLQLPDGESYLYAELFPMGQTPSVAGYLQNPSVALTGAPTAPTPSVGDNSNSIATTQYVEAYINTIAFIPPGSVWFFATNTLPSGYLLCDGSQHSRTAFARLFSTIGTTFGAGDGSTTFNLPNLGGYFVRGWTPTQSQDSGRGFGSTQANSIVNHQHISDTPAVYTSSTYTSVFGDSTTTVTRPGFTVAGSGSIAYGLTNNGGTFSGFNPNPNTIVTGETRGDNVSLLACIKY